MEENSNGLLFWVFRIAAKWAQRQMKQEHTPHSAVATAIVTE